MNKNSNKISFDTKIVVLLTSTIRPANATNKMIQVRRQQYEDALKSWMLYEDSRISGIVFCDNSTSNLDWTYELIKKLDSTKEFEALYCPDNKIPDGMHYGYPELGIIDYSVKNSQLIKESKYFAKVTGRLQFPSLSSLLNMLPHSLDACIDYRLAYRKDRKTWSKYRARTQLMLFKTSFYRKALVAKRILMIKNSIGYIEEFIPGLLVPGTKETHNCVLRWPIECPPSGVGGNGDDFDSRQHKLKFFLKNLLRKIFPNWWI